MKKGKLVLVFFLIAVFLSVSALTACAVTRDAIIFAIRNPLFALFINAFNILKAILTGDMDYFFVATLIN